MFRPLPPLAILLGIAGLIPFMVFGLAAVGANPLRSLQAAQGLVGYGAVILAFLGGVHWGFTLGEDGNGRVVRSRLGLGVVPSLVGWAAILCGIIGEPVLSLAVLIAGFAGTLMVEFRVRERDLMPAGYLALRVALSGVVLAVLTAVMVVRLIGGHILL